VNNSQSLTTFTKSQYFTIGCFNPPEWMLTSFTNISFPHIVTQAIVLLFARSTQEHEVMT